MSRWLKFWHRQGFGFSKRSKAKRPLRRCGSTDQTIDIVEGAKKPVVFVINGATKNSRITGQGRYRAIPKWNRSAATLHHSVSFPTSGIDGRAVGELDPESNSAKEAAELYQPALTLTLCESPSRLTSDSMLLCGDSQGRMVWAQRYKSRGRSILGAAAGALGQTFGRREGITRLGWTASRPARASILHAHHFFRAGDRRTTVPWSCPRALLPPSAGVVV